jgi:hypothetical protein
VKDCLGVSLSGFYCSIGRLGESVQIETEKIMRSTGGSSLREDLVEALRRRFAFELYDWKELLGIAFSRINRLLLLAAMILAVAPTQSSGASPIDDLYQLLELRSREKVFAKRKLVRDRLAE